MRLQHITHIPLFGTLQMISRLFPEWLTTPFMFSCYHRYLPREQSMDYISVGDYADDSFAALGSSDPREVRLELQLGFYVFNFQFVKVHFVFLLTEFHYTLFPCLIKYYHIMFINIGPPRGLWMDYRCKLVRKFIHCIGAQLPRGKIGLSYSLGLQDFIFSCSLFFFACSSILLIFFSFSVLFQSCCSYAQVYGKTLVHELSFPIVILNDTSFFRQCNYKCSKENSVRDGNTSQCTSNPVSTKLNYHRYTVCVHLC